MSFWCAAEGCDVAVEADLDAALPVGWYRLEVEYAEHEAMGGMDSADLCSLKHAHEWLDGWEGSQPDLREVVGKEPGATVTP